MVDCVGSGYAFTKSKLAAGFFTAFDSCFHNFIVTLDCACGKGSNCVPASTACEYADEFGTGESECDADS